MSARRLELDLSQVVEAMTASADDPFLFYLDTEDGTIHTAPSDSIDFSLDELPDEIAALLEVALQGKGAFARFREVVRRERDLEQSWFAFKDEADRARALAWL